MKPAPMTELSPECISFAWTATSGYKQYPPYVNLVGNRLTVRGTERDGAIVDQYFIEPGPYAFIDLPPEVLNELRAALNATLVDENAMLREALQFYADEWDREVPTVTLFQDEGQRARTALSHKETNR